MILACVKGINIYIYHEFLRNEMGKIKDIIFTNNWEKTKRTKKKTIKKNKKLRRTEKYT